MKNYLAQNLNFVELGAKMPFFWKIQNVCTKFHLNLKNVITFILRKIQNPIKFDRLQFHLNLKNAVTLILRKIQNPIKFEHLLRFQTKIEKSNYVSFIHSYEEVFGSKFEFRGTWSENALFFEKFKILWNLNASIYCSHIQSLTSLNIDLFTKNYLARPLKIYDS